MTITAKFASKCPACNSQIAEGSKVEWTPGSKARHIVCPTSKVEEMPNYAERVAFVEKLTGKPVARIAVEDSGVYVMPDGDIVKVQANREKTRTYAKRWVVTNSDRLNADGSHVKGEYVYEAGLVQQVAEQGRKMSLEEAKAFILQYGQCVRCGRKLKDGKSVEAGIGPVCVKYFSEGTTGAALLVGAA